MKDSSFAKLVVLVNALVPLAMLSWDSAHHRLGANPTAFITHTTGTLALIFLLASLAMTPLRKLSGSNYFSHFRKLLGLVGFFYAFLHLLTYLSFDRAGELRTVPADIAKRPFILVGMLAFFLLIPLAATSTSGAVKRLGAKRWKQLHRLAYFAAILGVIHYYLLVKADTTKPIAYGGVLALLLLLRLVKTPLFPPPQRRRVHEIGPSAGRSPG
jgi:sulfoxide reductase heme-binding subunit YedZ